MCISLWVPRLQTYSQNKQYLLLSYINNIWTNVPHCYVTRTLPLLLTSTYLNIHTCNLKYCFYSKPDYCLWIRSKLWLNNWNKIKVWLIWIIMLPNDNYSKTGRWSPKLRLLIINILTSIYPSQANICQNWIHGIWTTWKFGCKRNLVVHIW